MPSPPAGIEWVFNLYAITDYSAAVKLLKHDLFCFFNRLILYRT